MNKKKFEVYLYQPVEETIEETTETITTPRNPLQYLIDELKEEEDYYQGEQHNTKLMITRLRKVFYDAWGWSTEVIRGAASIEGRYEVKMIPDPSANQPNSPKPQQIRQKNQRKSDYDFVGLVPVVVYRKNDKVYPERAGQVPPIYQNDGQEIVLPNRFLCDIGHVFSGIDAMNYPAPLTFIPGILGKWFYRCGPYVKSNADFATWLGDVASTAGNFLFEQLQDRKVNPSEEEKEIEIYAPASDMLGNVDAFVIAATYDISTNYGSRFTDILHDFYNDQSETATYMREHRIYTFCTLMGLEDWNGETFANEQAWIKEQTKQLRVATAFYVYGDLSSLKGLYLAAKIWLRMFEKELRLKTLLSSFLCTLKKEIKLEPSIYKAP